MVRAPSVKRIAAMLIAVVGAAAVFAAAYFGILAYRAHLRRQHEWEALRAQLSRLDAQLEKESKAATPAPH